MFFIILKKLFICQVNIVTCGSVSTTCQASVSATCQVSVIVTCHDYPVTYIQFGPNFVNFVQLSPNFRYFCSNQSQFCPSPN